MARLTSARALLLGIACAAVGLAACSKSTGNSIPPPTPTSKATPTAGPSSSPAPSKAGVAYLPDAGNGAPHGLTLLRFLAADGGYFHYLPETISFGASVRSFAIASDGSLGLAVTEAPAGAYTDILGVLGTANANPIPGGVPYDTSIQPTAAPSASPPPPNATIPDVTGAAILATGNASVGVAMGPGGNGILGMNQLVNQAPQFNGFVGYHCNSTTITPDNGRANIAVSPSANGAGTYTALVRGPNDLVSFSITPNFGVSPPIYVFCVLHQDTTLGTSGEMLGRGAMAISPTNPGRGVIIQDSTSAANAELVTGMPGTITKTAAVALQGAGRANSVAIQPAGNYAVIGADSGLYVVSGVAVSKLVAVAQGNPPSIGPYQPVYTGGDGQQHHIKNVTSVGFSGDGAYVAVLASTTPHAPGGGLTASLIVLPFSANSGLLSAPVLVDNGLVTPPFNQDFMLVK